MGDAPLFVSLVAGAADELAVCVFLFVGAELAVGVVAVADVFAQGHVIEIGRASCRERV